MNTTDEVDAVLEQRGAQYGDFEAMARLAQGLKVVTTNGRMSSVQRESMDVICTKIARIVVGNPDNVDSWLDIAGYAKLVANHLRTRHK